MKKQLEFDLYKPKLMFGGALLKNGNPRVKRPLASKLPLHVVLRATKSKMRLPKNFKRTNELVRRACEKHGIRLYEYANVGNHLHLLIKLPRPRYWAPFIRELTGRIAQEIDLEWMWRPFTRVVGGWRRAYKIAKEYVQLNLLEAEGFISRKQTKTLRDLRNLLDGS